MASTDATPPQGIGIPVDSRRARSGGAKRRTVRIRGRDYPVILPSLRDPRLHVAAVLLTLAIVSHHFTAMGAVEIIPDPTRLLDTFSLAPASLALAIAGATVAVLGMSLIGAFGFLPCLGTRKRRPKAPLRRCWNPTRAGRSTRCCPLCL